MKTKAVIFDLDGTLADTTHRLHFLSENPKNWKSFFDEAKNDPPRMHVLYLAHIIANNFPIVICSGRPDSYDKETYEWLATYKIRYSGIYMRKSGDFRADTIVKVEMLRQLRTDGWEPILAIDDRPSVVQMWETNGVPVLIAHNSSWSLDKNESKIKL